MLLADVGARMNSNWRAIYAGGVDADVSNESRWKTLGVADVSRVLEEVKGPRDLPTEVLESVARAFQVRRDRPAHFGVQRRQLGGIGVVVMTMSAMRVFGLALRKSNTIHVGFVLEGSVTLIPREGEPVVLGPGGACLITNWSAFDVTCEDNTRAVHVLIQESTLRERGVRVHAARFRLEGQRTLGAPLLALALAVSDPEWDPSPTAARVVERSLEDLTVGLLLENADDERERSDLRAQLRRRCLEEIALRHRDATLTPTALAKQLGVSLRHLQRGFESSGTTVSEQILRHRAESAAVLLRAPGGGELTIAEIARAAGFSSAYELRSAVRTRFGVLPTELRGTAHVNTVPDPVEFRADQGSSRERSAIVK